MPERKKLFLKVLKAELEDCLEDVEDLANLYERRHNGDEVSNYVYNENSALLTRELSGLRNVIESLDTVLLNSYDSIESLAASVDAIIQKKVLDYEDPQAVYSIAKRKLLKVLRYIGDRQE